MSKAKASWAKPLIMAGAVILTVSCAACAPKVVGNSAGDAADAAVTGAFVQTKDASWEKWRSEYPLEVDSFFDGMDEVEAWDGKVHSHAMLYANVPVSAADPQTNGTACIACKSTTGTKLYEEMGLDSFSQPWDEYEDSIDWWDCGLCHVDATPGGELHYNGMAATAFGGTLLDSIDQKQAVCGQCHNYYGAVYTRGGLMKKMQSGEVDYNSVDPYRYGTDPESLMKAALEDGYEMNVDPETGIATFQANHPEIEIFQGSVMQEEGLACIDCHMPTKTSEDGQPYTSHNASSSPLENEEALEFCLTCHTEQGVESTDEMKQFVKDAQQSVADLEAQFTEKQTQLHGLIKDATAAAEESDALNEARDLYTRGTWYVRYADGGGDFKGQKVAHNPYGEREYVQQAIDMMDQGIALLS